VEEYLRGEGLVLAQGALKKQINELESRYNGNMEQKSHGEGFCRSLLHALQTMAYMYLMSLKLTFTDETIVAYFFADAFGTRNGCTIYYSNAFTCANGHTEQRYLFY